MPDTLVKLQVPDDSLIVGFDAEIYDTETGAVTAITAIYTKLTTDIISQSGSLTKNVIANLPDARKMVSSKLAKKIGPVKNMAPPGAALMGLWVRRVGTGYKFPIRSVQALWGFVGKRQTPAVSDPIGTRKPDVDKLILLSGFTDKKLKPDDFTDPNFGSKLDALPFITRLDTKYDGVLTHIVNPVVQSVKFADETADEDEDSGDDTADDTGGANTGGADSTKKDAESTNYNTMIIVGLLILAVVVVYLMTQPRGASGYYQQPPAVFTNRPANAPALQAPPAAAPATAPAGN